MKSSTKIFPLLLFLLFGISLSAQELKPIELPADLQQVLTDYETHWKNSDAEKLASLFTEDGFILRPGHEIVKGREKIEQAYQNSGGGDLVLKAYDYSIENDIAFIIGGYTYGNQVQDMGKYTLTLKKVNGKWLIHSDMDNGNN